MFGSVTLRKVLHPEAPSDSDASSSCVPCACISGISCWATKGKVTNIVASTIPGNAKMISTSCACSQGPSTPPAPNNRTNTSPEITGETEKGRSISVSSSCLPRKWNFAIAQAAETPTTMLNGDGDAPPQSASSGWLRAHPDR